VRRALSLIAASAALYGLAVWWAASRLPDSDVPMHVNTAGDVDRYADRAAAINYFVGLGGFLALLAVAVVCLCRWTPVRFLNVPHEEYWRAPERESDIRGMVVWDSAVLLSMPLIALACIPLNIAAMSDSSRAVSPLGILVPVGILLLAMAGYLLWMYRGRYRPDPADG
jgi:hypothetical protein